MKLLFSIVYVLFLGNAVLSQNQNSGADFDDTGSLGRNAENAACYGSDMENADCSDEVSAERLNSFSFADSNDSRAAAAEPFDYNKNVVTSLGGIIRADTTSKVIYLVFTGHEYADGFDVINEVFSRHNIKGSFFFTGDFYRNPKFYGIIRQLKESGNYLGAHSDKHLLYADWGKRDSTLVTKKEFFSDVMGNYAEMERFGVSQRDAPFYLPPYEWYNSEISKWTNELGLVLINFTPGTSSNQDWSIPELGDRYFGSDTIYNRILRYEEISSTGLNGFLLLSHIGTDPKRTDKFYNRLDELITELRRRGYRFGVL